MKFIAMVFITSLLSSVSFSAIKKDSFNTKKVYLSILKHYDADNVKELRRLAIKMYAKNPNSAYCDNSFYLLGRSQIRKKDYTGAIKTFTFLTKKFPKSKKVVSSLLAKATVYKELKLNSLAKKYYNKVITDYPGSIEQKRAMIEVKHL